MTMFQNDLDDPFADTGEKKPSLKFPAIGTTYTCKVTAAPKLVQSRDFTTGEPATWDDGNPKMSVVIEVEVDGEPFGLWAGKPSALFAAIGQAQKEAGAKIEPGGTLVVRYDSDKPNEKNPRLNAAKQYKVKYTAPKAAPAADPFGTDDSLPPF